MFTKEQINKTHVRDKNELQLTEEEIRRIMVHYCLQITALGKRLSLRQRVISTAIAYFRRFYHRLNFAECCPRLIGPTCLYIASKVEECSTQAPAAKFEKEMKVQDRGWPYGMNDILECEYYVLEALDFHLIVYHPYRPLLQYLSDIKKANIIPTEREKEFSDTAWSICNDSYCSDLTLMAHPYIIALAAMYLAGFLQELDLGSWFKELNIEIKDLWTAINELLEFYDVWKREREDSLKQLLIRIPAFTKGNSGSSTQPINLT